ncbi:MAG: pyrroline-5-carboxylate reductase [Alphaproteobacteria bacterium]|nr:pyrroline-5-carboxylate reductase [Alphaproteobacteria bacterium]MCB9690833.1 pyrroline-5-carboxylate reductase [Alphaproteobacteria bacterium]
MAIGLAVIGCGKMGQAIVGGLANDDRFDVKAVTARRRENARQLAEALGVPAGTDNAAAAREADIVLLSVKPQVAREVLAGMGDALDGKVLLSICAGVTTRTLAELAPGARVLRAMPNTPCLIREGMTVVAPGPRATDEDLETCTAIFGAVGRVRQLEEKHFDVVTALSGSGPAFACVVLESLADGGVRMGLPREVAVELAAQTMQGAARLVLQTGRHPAALKDEVTTPAGCTIAGLLTMEDGRIRSTLARTIEEAARVAAGLGGPPDRS